MGRAIALVPETTQGDGDSPSVSGDVPAAVDLTKCR